MYPIDDADWVLLVVNKGIAPSRCIFGEAWVVNDLGVRLRLHQFDNDPNNDIPSDCDFFVPWRHIESALVSRPGHDETDHDGCPPREPIEKARFFRMRAQQWVQFMQSKGWTLSGNYAADN